ncbi:MAG TPA: hypothetical protein VEX41_09145 [Candidatus Eisenbacteria bacterium]|nr:hypothetical protein [Candidatus Eisenbacteria bacterium]
MLSIALAAIVGPAIVGAALSADAPTPPGAEDLAEEIRATFSKELEVPFPPFRTRLARWETFGSHSYIVEVQVYDLLFGPFPKRGLVTAPCWSRSGVFSSGWLDDPGSETELRSAFLKAVACGAPPSP